MDGEDRPCVGIERIVVIQVFGGHEHGQGVLLHHELSVGEEEIGVGLQMHQSAIHEEAAVALHEECAREAFARILHLRVAECEPYLLHLSGGEEAVDYLDVCSKESCISESFLKGLLGARVHSCPLDVDADEVHVGEHACQSHGIFPLAATQLKHYRVVVVEIFLAPLAFHIERYILNH